MSEKIQRKLDAAEALNNMLLLCGEPELDDLTDPASRLRALIDGLITQRNRADAAEAEIARLKNFLQFLKTPLQEIDGLFGDIRNDWTDPRHECRSGRESVAIVEAMIEELLRTKDAG
ncbi:MAG: hypothetical protein KF826_03370 [Xanthobacteraceae bacterium]|nr:hypothetical protein [Xanthobacteraceae bacterium]